MNIKFYITSLLYLLVANGAKVLNHYLINEHPTAYLRWIQQFRHIPEMNWLNQSPYTQKRPFNQQNFLNSVRPVEFPYGYRNNNVQTINRLPQSYGNYCNQPLFRFPPYQGYSTNRNTSQFYIRQPVPSRPISQPNYNVMSQQRINADKPIETKSLDFLSQTKINQPMYQYSPNTHQKMQPMMCVPINSEREIEKLEREETTNETDEELQDDFIPNSHKNESYDEHNNHSPGIDEVDQEENTDRPKIKYTEHLHSHQTENNTSQRHPGSETVLRKKKRRRKRHRGPRNKKTEGKFLKGVHIAEDVATSGALGPQMTAHAIAAKAAETAIKGESAEEIMKKTVMTAASAAIGASTKAQMMNQVAERQPGSETVPLIVNNVNHTFEHKNELRKKKKRRKRHRGIRINKKIGGKLLKGVHIAEDLAASGALGPQMKAAAIAAKAAETAIKGAIKGESAEEIMKKTAMTAASAAIGGSTKAQMMSQVAAQSGIPIPPEMNSSGASTGGPLGIAGGGNLKQQMINQAGQQAMILAMNEVTKKANGNQTVQTPDGP